MWVFLLALLQGAIQFNLNFAQVGPFRVDIISEGEFITPAPTNYTGLGPNVGEILNNHFFPGKQYYEAGRYREAYNEFTYMINRPNYLDGNPGKAVYLSTCHYLRGRIFLYHGQGTGRLVIAQSELESAISWNPENYPAYLELSRLYSLAGMKDQSKTVLKRLLSLEPEKTILDEAQSELRLLETSN